MRCIKIYDMAKCKRCGNESDNYRLCTDCKKEWKANRLINYKIVVDEIGEPTSQNKKEFDKRLKKLERGKF